MPSLRYRPKFGEQSLCIVKMSAACFLRKGIFIDKTHTNSAPHHQPKHELTVAHGSTRHMGYFHPLIFVSSREVVHCTVGGPCLKSRISLPVQRKELQTAVLLGEGYNPKPGKGKVSLPPRRDEMLPSQQHMLPPPALRSSTSKSLTFPVPVPYIPNSHTIVYTPLSSVRQPIRLQVTSRQVTLSVLQIQSVPGQDYIHFSCLPLHFWGDEGRVAQFPPHSQCIFKQ